LDEKKLYFPTFDSKKILTLRPIPGDKYIYDGLVGYEHVVPGTFYIEITQEGHRYEIFKDMEGKSLGFINTRFTSNQADILDKNKTMDAAIVIERL
jgi:hypothetical protein